MLPSLGDSGVEGQFTWLKRGLLCETAQIRLPGFLYFEPEVTSVTHFCNHCENFENPVTPASGISVPFLVNAELQIDVYLHRECAESRKTSTSPLSMEQRALGAD